MRLSCREAANPIGQSRLRFQVCCNEPRVIGDDTRLFCQIWYSALLKPYSEPDPPSRVT